MTPQEPQEMFEHFRLEVDPGQAPVRIDKYMSTHLEDTSRNRIQQAFKEGYVRVGETPVKANYIVRPGDVIRFVMPYRRRGLEIIPQEIPLNIVHEDDDVLVVNKPAGMVVHPGHGHYEGTLINALAHHLGISQDADALDERMGILVHRIDKDTSGLLAVAKNDEAQLKLAKQFFDHSIERRYNEDEEHGKRAVTHWRVLERFGFVTLVECKLETGRTHQIRVHMAQLGHPIFNDERYGGAEIRKGTIYAKYRQFIQNCFALCPRQALHARTLGFAHPRTGAWLQFDSDLPEDMTALLDKWRKYCGQMPEE